MASFHLSIKNGKRGSAAIHAAYIARIGKSGRNLKEPDLVAWTYGNLPAWAKNDPFYFFKMADAGERENGAAYRELEFALPSELNQEQQKELAQEIVKQQIGKKPFLIAIHSPKAALGGVPQDHFHAMYSDRKPDGIDRRPEIFFSRYNRKNPELGGCKKDSGGKPLAILRDELKARRAECADIQNKMLEKYGHTARVDSRSYRDRGIVKNVEKHFGAAAIKNMSEEEKGQIKDKRQSKK